MSSEFTGFPLKSFQFLQGLRKHNTKDWFEAHRPEYQQFILQPMQSLVEELAPVMFEIDPTLEISPAVNKTISRIYRDTRFSKDKSPYKTSQWVTFKRPRREWQNFPAFFLSCLRNPTVSAWDSTARIAPQWIGFVPILMQTQPHSWPQPVSTVETSLRSKGKATSAH